MSKLLGHSTINQTLETYAHLMQDTEESMEIIEKQVQNIKDNPNLDGKQMLLQNNLEHPSQHSIKSLDHKWHQVYAVESSFTMGIPLVCCKGNHRSKRHNYRV